MTFNTSKDIFKSFLSTYLFKDIKTQFRLIAAVELVDPVYAIVLAYDSNIGFETGWEGATFRSTEEFSHFLGQLSSDTPVPLKLYNRPVVFEWLLQGLPEDTSVEVFSLGSKSVGAQSQAFIAIAICDTSEREKLIKRWKDWSSKIASHVFKRGTGFVANFLNRHRFREMAYMLNAHDPYTYLHSIRVADLVAATAHAMKVEPREVEMLFYAGLIHDLGKMWIPSEILHKPSALSTDEYEIVKQHVSRLDELFLGDPFMEPIIAIAKLHHERLDGSGYLGVKGEELSLPARILAVADVADALLHDRPYRAALPIEKAIKELKNMTVKGLLDEYVVAVISEIIPNFYFGRSTWSAELSLYARPVALVVRFFGGETTIRGTLINVVAGNLIEILSPNVEVFLPKGAQVQLEVRTGALTKAFRAAVVSTQRNHIFLKLETSPGEEAPLRILWVFEVLVAHASNEKAKKRRIPARVHIFGSDSMSIILRKNALLLSSGDRVKVYASLYGEPIEISGTVFDVLEVDRNNLEYWIKYDPMPESTLSKIYRSISRRQIEVGAFSSVHNSSPMQ
ncbi:MAG: HD domain-containing protein [Thermotogae bacterium]|nr:HD domain-containing protein [Thermotogota bacterium]